jgi:radical SAM superfamily enzyme YgiQ (UPF0313 family)
MAVDKRQQFVYNEDSRGPLHPTAALSRLPGGYPMKILLVEPAKSPITLGGEDFTVYEPLALEYVAAGVAPDHDVKILDMRLGNHLSRVLREFSPDVVGFTAYTVHVHTVRAHFDTVKAWNPEVLTVVGGHHATIVPEDFATPSVDLIVMGEGVVPFREIVARFEAGKGFDGIPGIAFQKNGRLVKADYAPATDLDSFPFPERGLTAAYRKHYYAEWMRPLASIRTSKGCPSRCSFCALWKIAGGRYLKRSPEKIVEELAGINEEYVFFADDESLVDVQRMKALARLIKESGLKKQYFLYGRSDTITRNPDLLAQWRDIGLQRVFVGLEFFREEDLAFIRKGSTLEDNRNAVRILQDLGIEIYASLIVRPEFTRQDFAALRRYCRELDLAFASFAVLTPLPGTDYYAEVESRLITRNYDFFDFVHTVLPTELPLKEFYAEYSNLYRSAVPLSRSATLLKRFPLKEMPAALLKSFRVLGMVKNAYRDYESLGTATAAR